MALRPQWIPADLSIAAAGPLAAASSDAIRLRHPAPELRPPPEMPIPVRKIPEFWRHAPGSSNELPPVLTIGGMGIASIIGILTLGIITPGDTPLPEDRRPGPTGAIDTPPAGKTVPAWLAELEESARSARLVGEKLLDLRIQQELGNTAAARQLEAELEMLNNQLTTSKAASPLMRRPLQIMASVSRTDAVHRVGANREGDAQKITEKLRRYVLLNIEVPDYTVLSETSAQPFVDWHEKGLPVLDTFYRLLGQSVPLDEDQRVNYRMRALAAMVLGFIPDPRSIPILISQLEREIRNPRLRNPAGHRQCYEVYEVIDMCLWALRRFGPAARNAIPVLEETLDSGINYKSALRALLHIQPALALERIWRHYQRLSDWERDKVLANFFGLFEEEDYHLLLYFFLLVALHDPSAATRGVHYFSEYMIRSIVLARAAPNAPELQPFHEIMGLLRGMTPYVPPTESAQPTLPATVGGPSVPQQPPLPAVVDFAKLLRIGRAEVDATLARIAEDQQETSQCLKDRCFHEPDFKEKFIQGLQALVDANVTNADQALIQVRAYPYHTGGLEID